MSYDSDSSSSGYSSDDDYLTSMATSSNKDGKAAEQEREAIIRRKLMESFYGSSEAAPESLREPKSNPPPEKKREKRKEEQKSTKKEGGDVQVRKEDPTKTVPSVISQPTNTSTIVSTSNTNNSSHPIDSESTNTNSNLNSQNFNRYQHTKFLLQTCNTENLLQHNETLAMNVRHLDSTMQTLVYENYSKFIDATDAVRSINQSVDQTAIQGLYTLQSSIQKIQTSNTNLNEQVDSLRQAVSEKLEIKHHLERLKNLLHLPQSLHHSISNQNYRTAMTRHAQAAMILQKHSNGLESLLKIEQECQDIMKTLIKDLMGRLLSWSGRGREYWRLQRGLPLEEKVKGSATKLEEDKDDYDDDMNIQSKSWNELEGMHDDDDSSPSEKETKEFDDDEYKDMDEDMDLPPLPKTVVEIFECAGSFDLLTKNQIQILLEPMYTKNFTSDKCKPLALDAIERMLERDLDHHRMNLINWKYGGSFPGTTDDDLGFYGGGGLGTPISPTRRAPGSSINDLEADMGRLSLEKATSASSGRARQVLREQFSSLSTSHDKLNLPSSTSGTSSKQSLGDSIVPTTFLDKMLQACSLFRMFFSRSKSFDQDPELLNTFVQDMFAAFLTQVKMDLSDLNSSLNDSSLEEEGMEEEKNETTTAAAAPDGSSNPNDDFQQIATALTHLIRSTQELANGLALPEVGISMEIASSMVDQTVELTESMIQRYISIRFHALRDQAVKDCVAPFIQKVIKGMMTANASPATTSTSSTTSTLTVAEIIRLASVAVAEMMQLADSKIEEVTNILSAAPVENDMVRLSIQKNSCQFALWLASAFEVLAGCDTIIVSDNDNGKKMLYIQDEKDDDSENNNDDDSEAFGVKFNGSGDMNFFGNAEQDEREDPLYALIMQMENAFEDDSISTARMVLALAQVCRMAEKSVIETINSSIGSIMKSDADSNDVRGRFAKNTQGVDVDSSGTISRRFQKASERILALYAMDQGTFAATVACNNIHSDGDLGAPPIPESPRSCMFEILQIAKTSSIDCATIIGGSSIAAPMKPFEAEESVFNHYSNMSTLGLGATMAGVHLDVERMFAQKTTVFKDSIEFDRDEILCSVLMIVFKALVERIRMCTFSLAGYRQMRVDVELFRHMVPHYVKSDLTGSLLNLLDDIMMNVRDRCLDKDTVGDGSEFYDEDGKMYLPGDILRIYMDGKSELAETFVITERMEEVA